MTLPALTLAKQLIQSPSITPDDAGCQTILSERLTKLGFQCEAMPFNNVTNLWARYGSASPLLCFAGHTDVVPPGPLAQWTTPPFMPTERRGYLYGRGAADMKGAIAAMVVAVEQFIKQHSSFPGSIAFLITSDEEGPSIDGTQKVIETLAKRQEKIDYCIVGEPCSEQTVGDQIMVGRRGSLHGTLTIHGKQGHIARPNLAKNPIHLSSLPLHELTQTIWDQGNAHFPPTSFQISNIQSGTGALNVIPGELNCNINFRYSDAVTAEQLQQRTEALLHQHGLTFEMIWQSGAHPFLTKQGVLIQKAALAIQAIIQQKPRLGTGGGTSDGRFIAATGAEVIELGAPCITAHHIDECIAIDDLAALTAIYEQIIQGIMLAQT